MRRRPLDELAWENKAVLAAVQALIGAVTPNMVTIALNADHRSKSVELLFAVEGMTETDAEEISEVVGEMDALLDGQALATTSTWIGAEPFEDGWPGQAHRRLFGRHRP